MMKMKCFLTSGDVPRVAYVSVSVFSSGRFIPPDPLQLFSVLIYGSRQFERRHGEHRRRQQNSTAFVFILSQII